MLISPTEPSRLLTLGPRPIRSSLPETYGVDFLWRAKDGWYGVQRKEFTDLIASLHDGRLGKEIIQMGGLAWKALIIEGQPNWSTNGELLSQNSKAHPFTIKQYWGICSGLQEQGIWVYATEYLDDTADLLSYLETWTAKEKHGSLISRPGPNSISTWGKANQRDYGIYFLMGLPGVGYELAGRIYDRFGCVPAKWTVGIGDLMQVSGIGKKKAETIFECLKGE